MSDKDPLEDLYVKDNQSSAYVIQVAIDNYSDIFNDLDPAPFKGRDLDPNLRTYIDECSSDIPLKHSLKLQFSLPKMKFDLKSEKRIVDGLRTYYSFLSYSSKKEYREKIKLNIYNIAVALILLSSSYILESILPENIVLVVFLEGLYIGGWVFLWRAFSIFAFEFKDMINEYKSYNRISNAQIVFVGH